jgi:phenylpropionate dioxygenase-like ring-hydroxylating dioxygenase large terminal subunit
MADELLRDLWYMATLGSAMKRGSLRRIMLLGEPVLLGRLKDDSVFALRDICPHRGVPLSAGRIADDATVECPYHGWRFRKDGVCSMIPSLVEGQDLDPSKIRVRSYPAREQDGLIWVYMAREGATDAPAMDPPKVPLRGNARPKLVESQTFHCFMDHAVVGLMDPAHGPFVHQSWWWRTKASIHAKAKKFAASPRGFTMTSHKPSSNSFAYRILGGEVSTEIRFELPGVRFEHIKAGRQEVVGFTACTPLDGETTQVTQIFYWTAPWLALIKPLFRPFARAFLGQDRAMVELQREGLKFNPRLMLIQDADTPALWYHRLKKAWTDSRDTGAPFANPVPETTLRWRS